MQTCFFWPFRIGVPGASFRGKGAAEIGRAALGRRRVIRVRLRAGDVLVCESGCLWLVEEGAAAPEDIVLEPGARRVWERGGTLLTEALRDAVWRIERAP